MPPMDLFSELETLDRSTLQHYAECPMRARLKEEGHGQTVGRLAEAGEQIHRAYGDAIKLYVESGGTMPPSEIAEAAWNSLLSARADVQPDAVESGRRILWEWSRYVASIAPENILHFDGGEGDWSGQVAHDFEALGVRVTSEVDLAHVGASKEIIEEADYKTGWKRFDEDVVRESFQFQLHALLLLENYPAVEEVRVRVWNTRFGYATRRVSFTRGDLPVIRARVHSAVSAWRRNNGRPIDAVEAWPVLEKCRACDVAGACKVGDREAVDFAMDPHGAVDTMAALRARLEALTKVARAHVRTHGDIVTPAGNAFGVGKPRKPRAPTADLYCVTSDDESGEDGGSDT